MSKAPVAVLAAVVVALGLALPAQEARPAPAEVWSELHLKGGRVWVGHGGEWRDDQPVSARYGELQYTTTRHEGAVTVKLPEGAFVMPGLQDAHGHLLGLGSSLVEVDLVGTTSYAQVIDKAREAAARLPKGSWVVGRGWDQNDWPETAMPHHEQLTRAVPDHPVWLVRVDGHAGLANGPALRSAGITGDSVAPSGGEILFDQNGQPTGVLVDAAMGSVPEPRLGKDQIESRLLAAQQACLRHGLTCVHDMGVSKEVLDTMVALHAEGRWFLRVQVMLAPNERELIARGPWQTQDGVIVVRGVKAYADGALGSRGAALLEPYSDRPGSRGLVSLPKGAILALAQFCADNGMQLCTHAIGDAANRTVLDAYEAVTLPEDTTLAARRFRVEHAQVIAADDFVRFRDLGVLPSMQPTHLTSDMPWAPERLGAERVLRAYAWSRFHELGVVVPFGSDFPVESVDPRMGIFAAVTTRAPGTTDAMRPDQQLSRERTLRGFTHDAAYATFDEQRLGAIRPGMKADLTVFDRDLRSCSEQQLLEAQVLLTVIGGRIVYDGRTR